MRESNKTYWGFWKDRLDPNYRTKKRSQEALNRLVEAEQKRIENYNQERNVSNNE